MKRTVFLLLSMLIGILFVFSACKTLEPDESSSRQESGMPPQPPAFPFGPGAVQTTGKTVKSSLSLFKRGIPYSVGRWLDRGDTQNAIYYDRICGVPRLKLSNNFLYKLKLSSA